MRNGSGKRFIGSIRRGVLDMHIFRNLSEVREQPERRLTDYNNETQLDSLHGRTAADFRVQNDRTTSNLAWRLLMGSGHE